MSAESLEQPRPDTPGGGSDGPADGTPDHVVVTVGVIAVLAVVAWAALGKDSFDTASGTALSWVLGNFAWLFVIAADVFLVMCVVLAISRFGRIRLGADDSEPEFTNLAWIAMMFSAGMGIGLMFYGVGEPSPITWPRPRPPGRPPPPAPPPSRPWSTPSSTGPSPPGRSTASPASPWPTRPSARAAATASAPPSSP